MYSTALVLAQPLESDGINNAVTVSNDAAEILRKLFEERRYDKRKNQ